jgi:hypothetical protein
MACARKWSSRRQCEANSHESEHSVVRRSYRGAVQTYHCRTTLCGDNRRGGILDDLATRLAGAIPAIRSTEDAARDDCVASALSHRTGRPRRECVGPRERLNELLVRRSLLPFTCGDTCATRLFTGLRAVFGRKHFRRRSWSIDDVYLTTGRNTGGEPGTPLSSASWRGRTVVRKVGTGVEHGVIFEHVLPRRS